MRFRNKLGNKGYTIIELMIATSVFTVVILGASAVVVQVSRLYYKGVILSRTQDTARNITDDISRQVQFNGSTITTPLTNSISGINDETGNPATVFTRCIGDQRYTWIQNMRVDKNLPGTGVGNGVIRHAMWRDTVDNAGECSNIPNLQQSQPTLNGESLLGDNMRLTNFKVNNIANTDSVNVIVHIGYGSDADLFIYGSNPVLCQGQVSNSQWCATAQYNTTVTKRIE